MKTIRIIIDGDVQGVGYRSWFKREAETHHILGYVKNRDDGAVEAVISGDDGAVATLLAIAKRGPHTGRVSSVTVVDGAVTGSFTDFRVVY